MAGQMILAGIFIYAGYAKLREPWLQFAISISSFKLVSDSWLEALARWLPWAELVLGLAILSGILLRWSALIASLVLAFFFAVLIRAYAMGVDVDCGCFGAGESHLGPLRLAEEAAMLALAVCISIAAFHRASRVTSKATPLATRTSDIA
jgi:putative oxidoreductase